MGIDPLMLEPLWPSLSWLSYRVVAVCLASVPATHAVGLYIHAPKALLRFQNALLFPLTGGNRHIVFQVLAWSMWLLSALSVLPLVVSPHHLPLPTIPNSHVDVVSGAAASCAFIGELFMLKAMLVYDDTKFAAGNKGAGKRPTGMFSSPTYSAAAAIVMGFLLSVTGILQLAMLEYMPDMPSRVLYCCLSLSCLTIAASTTYGLGGFLRYLKGGGQGGPGGGAADWAFFQPFMGGTAFVATQAVAWSMYSATVVCMVWVLQRLAVGMAFCVRCWVVSCGLMMIATQVVLALSVLLFKGRSRASHVMLHPPALLAAHRLLSRLVNKYAPLVVIFLPAHTFFALWALSFTFMPLAWAIPIWAGLLLPYYMLTNFNEPHHTGCREWPAFTSWLSRQILPFLTAWFGRVEILQAGGGRHSKARAAATTSTTTPAATAAASSELGAAANCAAAAPAAAGATAATADASAHVSAHRSAGGSADALAHGPAHASADGSADGPAHASAGGTPDGSAPFTLDPNERHVIGFHPHGYYPTGAGFLSMLPAWGTMFPGVNPVTLVASVMFVAPAVRDFASWLGFRVVSRKTFVEMLRTKRHVMMCPGGQAELVHTWRAFKAEPEFVLHTRHKGFIRVALQEGANLVPVLALGEILQLRNLVNAPAMQQYTYRRVGFPIPFLLVGRWGISPLPAKTDLLYVVGAPIKCPVKLEPGADIPDALLDSMHQQYYASLADMFEQHKHLHPQLQHAKLVLETD